MSLPQKYFPVTWEDSHRDAKALAWRLADRGPWKGIVAVTRGGMVPAAVIARELKIHIIETVCVIGYHDDDTKPKQEDDVKLLKSPAGVGDGAGWLVVDDLVDSGRTVEALRRLMPKAHYAAVYAKTQGRRLIDTFITEVSQDTWIYFPWEDVELQGGQPVSWRGKER